MSKNSVMYTKLALTFLCLLCVSPLGLTLAGCESTEDPVAPGEFDDGTSWLAIGSGVKGMESEWLLLTPDGEEIRGIGGSLISNPVEGEYWLLWEPVPEFNSPVSNPASIIYSRGKREIFESDYRPLTDGMGMLLIEPGIANPRAPWNLHGPDGFFAAGSGPEVLFKRGVGEYQVTWGDLAGYTTPPDTSGDLVENETLTLESMYQPVNAGTGRIEIDPTPDDIQVQWELDSAGGGHWEGLGDAQFDDMPYDRYTIQWGEVEGWVTPETVTADLEYDGLLIFSALYFEVDVPTGTLVINADPDELDAPWQVASSHGWAGNGTGDRTLEGLPVGEYAVVWGEVEGFVTPAWMQLPLTADQTLQFDGIYESLGGDTGTVYIDPDPDELLAPWTLESDQGDLFTGAGDSTLTDLQLGIYTLTWGEVEGFDTPEPNPVTQTLSPGGSAVFAIE
ncbi:hypothetical protein DRQ53_03110 [bacterium]|nr:MAG: hypothetical protein DRQ32_07410 [bacterium]RKZ17589.1 MAG: hypothetical protein DRQ53_03110 [bacterium]